MAVCIAVIGKDNSPQFIACSKPDLELEFHYKVHTSLDVVEEKLSSIASSEIRKLYLGLLHSTEEHKIYGYATNTKIKFIIVVETSNTSLRDNDIQTIFRKLHSTYVDIVSNPFYIPGDNLASSIRGLSSGESLSRNQIVNASEDVNLNAGIDILENYQVAWAELHEFAQENAVKAQEVDNLIGRLHKKLQKQSRDISQMGAILIRLPEIIHSVNELMERIASLDDVFIAVEKTLIQFEDLMEIRELQDRQLDHRFQLALYKEKKLSMLENFREKLAEEHAEKIRKHELRQERIMKERQQTFEEQFKQDIKVYKETNTISKVNAIMDVSKSLENDNDNTLEDVKLEPEDCNALDEFLKDNVNNLS